jgi:hypothetical protein
VRLRKRTIVLRQKKPFTKQIPFIIKAVDYVEIPKYYVIPKASGQL